MLLLVVYAAAVWYALYAWRRSWRGLLIWLGSVAVLLAIAVLHYWSWLLSRGWIIQPPMRVMFYPYIGLVGIAGMLFYLMPRSDAQRPCPRCGYEVDGLVEEGKFTCPECGSAHAKPFARGTVILNCFSCKANIRGSHARPDIRCHRCHALHVLGAAERGLIESVHQSAADPSIENTAAQDHQGHADQRCETEHSQLAESQRIDKSDRRDAGASQKLILSTEPQQR